MGNVWRVFRRDLKRLGKVPLAWVIIGGALITPSLYAWFNISAFWDPFDNTKNLSIAVVNLDEGGETALTGEVNVGDQLVEQLQDNTDLGWHFVSKAEAMDSVKSGESFAAFVVPETFTQDLLSITTGDFTQPKLEYYVNEKLNGVAPEITDTGSTTIQTQMTDAFTAQVAEAVVTAITSGGGTAEQNLITAQDRATAELEAAASALAEIRSQLAGIQTGIVDTRAQLGDATATLSSIGVTLGDVQLTLADARALADQAQSQLLNLTATATTGHVLGSAQVAEAAAGAIAAIGKVTASTHALSSAIDAQRTLLGEASGLLTGLDGQLGKTSEAIAALDGDFAALETDVNAAITDIQMLGSAAGWQQLESLTGLNAEQISQFMSTPVVVNQHTLFETKTYGSLMASLFINLSLWIGAFVLVVILKQEVDKEEIPDLTDRQGYLGRWLLFAMIAVMQAVVLSIGNLLIGVQHVNTFAFIITPVLIGLSYLSIIYALAVTFGYIGKGLAVILVIMQIPGASGIYPIELMPQFFQAMYPFFPFTYGIDMMREVISGFAGLAYWRYLGTLLIFVAIAFLLGLVLRRGVSNLTRLFTQEVAETELFTNEEGVVSGRGYRLNHLLRALANRASYQKRLAKRALPFAKSYRKVRGAILIVGVAGIALLWALAMAFPDAKTTFVGLWILWLLIVFVALIALEYARYSLRLSTEVGNMPEAQIRKELEELEARR